MAIIPNNKPSKPTETNPRLSPIEPKVELAPPANIDFNLNFESLFDKIARETGVKQDGGPNHLEPPNMSVDHNMAKVCAERSCSPNY